MFSIRTPHYYNINFDDSFETYINQILGDQTVREIISEVWPQYGLKFATISDEGGYHHIVKDDDGYEYNSKNTLQTSRSDNLCQSYSLAFYFGKLLFKKSRKRNQMEIIELIKLIFRNEKFISILDDELIKNENNKHLWCIYDELEPSGKYVKMDIDNIVKNIFNTLKIWEKYGYTRYMY
jgi:hypothetical protein